MTERRAQSYLAAEGFIDALTGDPDLVKRLLEAHVEENEGDGRCMGCSQDDRRRPTWPCGPRGHAVEAQKRIDDARRQRWITP